MLILRMLSASARYPRFRIPVETGTPPYKNHSAGGGGMSPAGVKLSYTFSGAGYSSPKVSTVIRFIR